MEGFFYFNAQLRADLEKQIFYVYPRQEDTRLKTKVSVSEIKNANKKVPEIWVPSFIEEKSKTAGAQRGTVYHKIFEMLDFSKKYESNELAEFIKIIDTEKTGYTGRNRNIPFFFIRQKDEKCRRKKKAL
jgi:ATP-dependent helicase/nuclease subunit A